MKPLILVASLAALLGLTGIIFLSVQSSPDAAPEEHHNEKPSIVDGSGMTANQSATSFSEISVPVDCSNECAAFPESSTEHAYCESVCGLSPADSEGSELPRSPIDPSLEQMIRQKDEAIKSRDLAACRAIVDSNLRTACEVRVTEDLLE